MDHPRHLQHCNSQQPLDDSSEVLRTRPPLSHTAGNSQALDSADLHDDSKATQLRMDPSNFTLPSQPPRRSLANTLELRRQSTRRQRDLRYARNPIENSPQYRAYRDRQHRDGNLDDQKWNDVLEEAFLNGRQSVLLQALKLLTIVKRSCTYPKWADANSLIGANLTVGTSSSRNTCGSLMCKVYPLANVRTIQWPVVGSRSPVIYKSSRDL
jgi:hypothetical protein